MITLPQRPSTTSSRSVDDLSMNELRSNLRSAGQSTSGNRRQLTERLDQVQRDENLDEEEHDSQIESDEEEEGFESSIKSEEVYSEETREIEEAEQELMIEAQQEEDAIRRRILDPPSARRRGLVHVLARSDIVPTMSEILIVTSNMDSIFIQAYLSMKQRGRSALVLRSLEEGSRRNVSTNVHFGTGGFAALAEAARTFGSPTVANTIRREAESGDAFRPTRLHGNRDQYNEFRALSISELQDYLINHVGFELNDFDPRMSKQTLAIYACNALHGYD